MPYMPYFGVLNQVDMGTDFSFVSEETVDQGAPYTYTCSSCSSESAAYTFLSAEHPASGFPVGTLVGAYDGVGIWWYYYVV